MGIGGCLYAVGGMDSPKAGHWGLPLKTVERYDPDLDVWTEVASMNEARFGCAVAAYQVSIYSCYNITTTLIQISHLFYFGFLSKTNHQMII